MTREALISQIKLDFDIMYARTWLPDKQQSQKDNLLLAKKVRTSLLEIAQECSADSQAQVLHLIGEEGQYRKIMHPDFFEWYFELVQAITSGTDNNFYKRLKQLSEVFQVIHASKQRALANKQFIGVAIDITRKTKENPQALVRAKEIAEEIHGCPLEISLLKQLDKRQVKAIQNSFTLLKDIWSEVYEEIEDFVQCLEFFSGEQVIGFVDFQNHGSIFLRQDDMDDEVWLAEQVLHEASHIRLNAVLAVTPLFLNDDKARYQSPLRREPRPMFGLFHQMFVLSRLFYFYMRLSSLTNEYEEKLQIIHNHLEQAVDVVYCHADLTISGREMVDNIYQLINHKS